MRLQENESAGNRLPTLLLIDAYSLIYRAFYAIRNLTAPNGDAVNAIFGFTKMVRKLVSDYQPTHLAVVYDLGAPVARLQVLPSYKENRAPTPPDLDAQLPHIRDVITALGIPIVELEGEEADDVIATLARRAAADDCVVFVASNDKDLAQLVTQQVHLLRPDSGQTVACDAEKIKQRYGVRPDQIVDFLSMVGDSVDDIPGIPGVGAKTAARLLEQFDTFDTVLDRLEEVTRPKLREALHEHAERVKTNRTLVRLRDHLELSVSWNELRQSESDQAALRALYQSFGFKSLLAELPAGPQAGQGDLFT